MVNKINPNPKPRFPKGKTHKDMRIVRPIDLDPIVDVINTNSEDILEIQSQISGLPSTPLRYKAYLTQTSTDAPEEVDIEYNITNTPLVDTLDGVWSYNGVGEFRYKKVGAFADNTKFSVSIYDNRASQLPEVIIDAIKIDDDTIEINSYIISGFSGLQVYTKTDGIMVRQLIEIVVEN